MLKSSTNGQCGSRALHGAELHVYPVCIFVLMHREMMIPGSINKGWIDEGTNKERRSSGRDRTGAVPS